MGSKLPSLFASVKTVQLREDRSLGTKFFRLRVLINLLKPLQRIVRITTPDGTTHAGLIKYERLPIYFFICGLIGHRLRECPSANGDSVPITDLNYGSWMRGVDNLPSDQIFSKEIGQGGDGLDGFFAAKTQDDTPGRVASFLPNIPDVSSEVVTSESMGDLEIPQHPAPGSLTPQKRKTSDSRPKQSLTSPNLASKKMKILTAAVARQPRRSP